MSVESYACGARDFAPLGGLGAHGETDAVSCAVVEFINIFDNVFVNCDPVNAVAAGGAARIVTLNLRDLSRLELKFPEIVAVTPGQFLKEMKS